MRTFTQLPTPQSLLCSFSYKGREGRGQTDQCHKPNFSQSKKKKKMEEPAATFLVPTPPPPPLQELLQDILLRSISESQVTPSEVFNNNKKKKKKKQNIYFHPQSFLPPPFDRKWGTRSAASQREGPPTRRQGPPARWYSIRPASKLPE